jgi:membrane protease YdiL (CAAX protease family)
MQTVTLFDHALVALFGIALPVHTALRGRRTMRQIEFDTATKIATYYGNSLVLWLAAGLVLLVWWSAGRSFADFGFGSPANALGGAFLLWYAIDACSQVCTEPRRRETQRRWKRDTPFMPENGREMAHFCLIALSAGVGEEIVFRGYLISYLRHFTGQTWPGLAVAITAPAVIFGLAHLYQGRVKSLKITAVAIAFGAIYILTGSLWIPIALHVLIDLLGGVLGLWLLPRHP